MQANRTGGSVFVVTRLAGGKWEVRDEGLAKTLARFDEERDALNYASSLANSRPGSSVTLLGAAANS